MTLELLFFKGKDVGLPYQTVSFDIEGSANPSVLHCELPQSRGLFHDCTYVEAKLTGGTNFKGRYRLQLAYKPDYEPVADKDGEFVDNNENKRLQLLRGACGVSLMRLLSRTSTAPESEWKERFTFHIEVEPAREKRTALNCMVDELLEDSPQDALSKVEGLSRVRIDRRWVRGDVPDDWCHVEMKYEEMLKLYKSISPRLESLKRHHSINLVRGFEYMGVESLHRIPRITIRDIEKKSARVVIGRKVMGSVVIESDDIDIHRAIKDFLVCFRSEARLLLDDVAKSMERDRREIGSLVSQSKKQKNQWDIADKEKEIAFKKEMESGIRRMIEGCTIFLAGNYPWSLCRRLSIVYVPAERIPSSEHYRYLHAKILQFIQKRFFWSSVHGRFFVPQYVRYNDGEPSAWQKNYSYIYEAWVFKRIIEAFSREGFQEISENHRKKARQMLKNLQLGPVVNDPIHAEMTNGEMCIDLFHGLRACKHEKGDSWSEFTTGKVSRLTPDFAIIFTNPKGSGMQFFHWIVLDAKSGWKLDDAKNDPREKREMYLRCFLRYEQPPDQSWLVYSGEYEGKAKVEFDEIEDNMDHFTWGALGIEGWSDRWNQCRGHLRVNCNSVKTNDVFREFARVEIATANKRLGLLP